MQAIKKTSLQVQENSIFLCNFEMNIAISNANLEQFNSSGSAVSNASLPSRQQMFDQIFTTIKNQLDQNSGSIGDLYQRCYNSFNVVMEKQENASMQQQEVAQNVQITQQVVSKVVSDAAEMFSSHQAHIENISSQ